jgi:hypothetical protein
MLKLQVENDKLEFLIDRLCLPMNFAKALKMFEAAKIVLLTAFIEEIAKIEEEVANSDELVPLNHQGQLHALSAFINEVVKNEALSAFTNEVKDHRPPQEGRIIAAFEACLPIALVVTEVPVTPVAPPAQNQYYHRIRQENERRRQRLIGSASNHLR